MTVRDRAPAQAMDRSTPGCALPLLLATIAAAAAASAAAATAVAAVPVAAADILAACDAHAILHTAMLLDVLLAACVLMPALCSPCMSVEHLAAWAIVMILNFFTQTRRHRLRPCAAAAARNRARLCRFQHAHAGHWIFAIVCRQRDVRITLQRGCGHVLRPGAVV